MTPEEAHSALRDFYLNEGEAIFEAIEAIVLSGGDRQDFIFGYASACLDRDLKYTADVRQFIDRIKVARQSPAPPPSDN